MHGPPQQTTAALNVQLDNTPQYTQKIIDKYETVFHGTKLLTNFELQLHIDLTIVPVQYSVYLTIPRKK